MSEVVTGAVATTRVVACTLAVRDAEISVSTRPRLMEMQPVVARMPALPRLAGGGTVCTMGKESLQFLRNCEGGSA